MHMNIAFLCLHLLWETLKHRKKIFLFCWLAIFSVFFVWIKKIPRRYQSSALFNFHSDFSKIPASSEFFSEMYDPNEIRAEKDAILLGVLSDDFLVGLAEKYLGEEAAQREWIVQGLRKDIRFIPLSRTTYQLIVLQRSPEIVEKIAWDVVDALEAKLRGERLLRMRSVYESMTQQLQELTIDGQDKDVSLHLNASRLRLESEIQKLESLYTAEHPKLIRLRTQLQNLKSAKQASRDNPLARGHAENWMSLRGILVTRQALLQVAIRMEEKGSVSHIQLVKEPDHPLWPVEPKKNLLLISAVITSTVAALSVSTACSLSSELHALFPNIKVAWRRFRKGIADKKHSSNLDEDRNS